jgi:predicted nucleotidyltransferase
VLARGTVLRRTVKDLSHPDMPDPLVLSRIGRRLRRELGAERVIVYGSVARGRATLDSDIDLLVIAPPAGTSYARMARAREAIRDLSFGLPVSPLVLTPDELRRRAELGDPFILEILDFGIEI